MKNKYLFIILMTSLLSATFGFLLMSFYINNNLNGVAVAPSVNLNSVKPALCNTCVYINKTEQVNKQGSPILKATIYKNGKYQKEFKVVSGREYTQTLNRNIAGNKSPLPNGEYIIGNQYRSYLYETGYVFLPFTPLFITERSELGAHVDPSWGINNGENGTSGCIGFQSLKEFNNFTHLITYNNIDKLIVNF